MPVLFWIAILMAILGPVLIVWSTRNLFAPLNIAILFTHVLPFIGCLMFAWVDPEIGSHLAYLTGLGILCAGLGGVAARWWFRHNPVKELAAFRAQKVQSLFASDGIFTMALFSFILLGMAVVGLFFFRTGIPLLSPIVSIAKVEAAREGGYLSVRFMRLYLPLLIMIYFVGYRVRIRPNRFVIASTALFIVVAFTLFGYRGYVLSFFVLPLALLLGYQKLSKRLLTILGVTSVGSAALVTAIMYGETSLRGLWEIISQRAFLAYVWGGLIPIVYKIVPTGGYLHGRGFLMDIPAALSRLGIGPPGVDNFAQYLARIVIGDTVYGWGAAPTLVGEAYVNFGVAGIVVILFLFGFLMQSIYIRTLRAPKDVFLLPLSIYVQHSLLIGAIGPFVFNLIDACGSLGLFVLIFVTLYVVWSLPRRGPRFHKHSALPEPQAQPAALNRRAKKSLYPRPRWVWRKS